MGICAIIPCQEVGFKAETLGILLAQRSPNHDRGSCDNNLVSAPEVLVALRPQHVSMFGFYWTDTARNA
jgi:hypothetical protein